MRVLSKFICQPGQLWGLLSLVVLLVEGQQLFFSPLIHPWPADGCYHQLLLLPSCGPVLVKLCLTSPLPRMAGDQLCPWEKIANLAPTAVMQNSQQSEKLHMMASDRGLARSLLVLSSTGSRAVRTRLIGRLDKELTWWTSCSSR